MNKSMRFLLVLILAIIGQVSTWGASSPTSVGNYINLKDGTYSGPTLYDKADSEGGYKVGNIRNGYWCSYDINVTEQAYYSLCMAIHYNSGGVMNVTITDATTGAEEVNQDITITKDLAKDYGNEVAMPISYPLSKGVKTMKLSFTPVGKYLMDFENLRVIKRADYTPDATTTLKSAKVDGLSLPAEALQALKDNKGTYKLSGNTYTKVPELIAWMSDNTQANVTSAIEGTSVIYTIKALNYEAHLTVEGLNIYTPGKKDKTVQLKYTTEGADKKGNWSNGLYSLLSSDLDGWNNSSFKLNDTKNTIQIPSNIKVKQVIFKDLSNNYNGAASISEVTSEGATAYLPTRRDATKGQSYDLCVNIEGHQTGKEIVFNLIKAGQPTAWIELTVEETTEGNPTVVSTNSTVVDNHAVITVNFDREVKAAKATCNQQTLSADGGSTSLQFAVWDLEYNSNYTLQLPAKNVSDNYGNNAKEDIVVNFATTAAPVVKQAAYDYVVSNATELDAAIAALRESNKTADAARKVVFLKNGKYTYGTLTGPNQHNVSLKESKNNIYNVSLIGESKEGVLIEGTTDGITSSTLDLGDGTGNYLQDITIRNNFDFRSTLKGVSVALNGGNKTVLKNVALQSSQDTYVTGKRTYLEDCDVYGTTDFICGGGNIYFERCNLILGNKTGNVISAPNTDAATKWGYVFQNCTVKADEGASLVADGNWNLGRPWQNEPRTYYLNTKMEVLCSNAGWTSMGDLTTHFYEYQSYDKDGKLIDLSTRKNSPTSLNQYSPILTDEEAAQFTLRNVLGGSDSWDAISETKLCAAPEQVTIQENTLSWQAVADARCYVIFKNGEYMGNTTATSFTINGAGNYAVCAANKNGGLGIKANAYLVTTNAAGWASFCAAENTTLSGEAKTYVCTAVDNNIVTLEPVTHIPANKGVFIKGEPNATYQIAPAKTGDAVSINLIKGCLTATTLAGTEGAYILGVKNGKAGIYQVTSSITVPAGKAYLQPATTGLAKFLSIAFPGSTTAIEGIEADGKISSTNKKYNLAGQRTESKQGIIIMDGKKYIIK